MSEIDIREYIGFVNSVTSGYSSDTETLIQRLKQLEQDHPDLNMPRLLTAVSGLCGESGEFSDVVKKVAFQEKPYTEEVQQELKKELGDLLWYWAQGVMGLGLDPYEVIQGNIDKLSKRYPGGFEGWRSENRLSEE